MHKTIEIKGQRYEIPTQYILPDLPSTMVPRGEGMDTDNGVTIEIPLHDLGISPLQHESPTGFAKVVHILLYGPSAFTPTNEYGLNSDAYDAWTGSGNYRNRAIVRDKMVPPLHRVYWREGGKSWNYFVDPPTVPAAVATPKWVAACRLWGHGEEAGDMSNVLCDTDVSIEQGDADISFSGRYINQVDIVIEGVKKKIQEWAASD